MWPWPEIEQLQLDEFRHELISSALLTGLKKVAQGYNIHKEGRKGEIVERMLEYLNGLVSRELWSEYEKFVSEVKLGASSFRKECILATLCQLRLQYRMGLLSSTVESMPPLFEFVVEEALSPKYSDRIPSFSTSILFTIGFLQTSLESRVLLLSTLQQESTKLHLPLSARISVNGLLFPVNRYDVALDITSYCAQNRATEVIVSYRLTSGKWYSMQIVRARIMGVVEQRQKVLEDGNQVSRRENTIERIRTVLGGEGELESTNLKISFLCPLSQRLMVYPGRFKGCLHVQCFDVEIVLDQLLREGSQRCCVCGYVGKGPEDLMIDEFFLETAHMDVGDSVMVDRNGFIVGGAEMVEIVDLTITPDGEYTDEEPLLKNEDGSVRRMGVFEISDEDYTDDDSDYRTLLARFSQYPTYFHHESGIRPAIIDTRIRMRDRGDGLCFVRGRLGSTRRSGESLDEPIVIE